MVAPSISFPTPAVRGYANEHAEVATRRLISLDAFRGLTIAAMILVNDPGSWESIYPPLRHAAWHGWTPTDLIFPFFLFIVGVSTAYSLDSRGRSGQGRLALIGHIVWRSAVLVGLGLLLNGMFFVPIEHVRYPGVLQRIGVVYLACALIALSSGRRTRIALVALLLGGYWALMTLLPVPGHGAGDLSPAGNLASYWDARLLAGHMWTPTWDPEGILSTLPALATALLGMLAAGWLRSGRDRKLIAAGMLAAGAAGLAAGEVWNLWFPINKNLWTSSFVIFTAGFALVMLAVCYWLLDIRGWRGWAQPFVALGMNPLIIYACSEAVAGLLAKLTWPGTDTPLQEALYQRTLHGIAAPENTSLLWALAYLSLWWMAAWKMYRNKIFFKI